MGIVISGLTATQSGTDTLLGTAIDTMTGLTIQSGWLRVMPDGSLFTVNGTFTDATGNFALMLLGTARMVAQGNGIITIGSRALVAGNPVYTGGGLLVCKPNAVVPLGYNINYSSDNGANSRLDLYDTELILFSQTSNTRTDQLVSNAGGCKIRCINQGAGANQFTDIRLRTGAIFDDNIVENMFQFEFYGQPASFARNKFINSYGFISYGTGALIFLDNIQFTGTVANAGITNNGGLYYVNTFKDGTEMTEAFINALRPSSFAGGIVTNTNPALHGIHWGKTHREIIKNPNGDALTNAKVYFRDSFTTPTVFLPTLTGGAYTQTIRLKRATTTGFATITYANYYPITKGICEYNSIAFTDTYQTYDAMPAHAVQQTRILPVDTSITQTNSTTVAAYTDADSSAKAYDLSKLWMINNYTGQALPGLARIGTTISTTKNIVIDPDAATAYAETANTITLKASVFFGGITTTGTIANSGTLSGAITGTVTNTGTLGSGTSITGNVNQATPTNLTGVTITGNLIYNTATPVNITLTNCTITGTVTNSGTGTVSVNLVNSTINTGANVTAQYPITVTDANGANFSTQIWVFNSTGNIVEDTGFSSLVASKTVYMPVGGSIRVYSQAYGTQSKITNTNAANASLVITHIPETLADTSLPTATRNTVAGYFSSVVENSLLYVEVDTDLANYTPAEVLNAMHYFIVSNGGNFAALSLLANTVGSVKLIDGGFRVYSAFFKGRAKSNLNATNTPSLYITLPLYIEDASGVSGNQVMVRNANGIDVHAALWSKATANISQNDMNSIASTTWSHNKRTLNDAIFE